MLTTSKVEPRIYVACLASYNNGVLHGKWIDATQSAEDIRAAIADVLRSSKFPNVTLHDSDGLEYASAEEWAIHDYEGFGSCKLSESEDIDTVAELAEAIEDNGDIYSAYVDHVGQRYASVEGFKEDYQGAYASLEAYAESYIEDTGMLQGVPDTIARYFDYESFARDLELGGDVYTIEHDGECHVFSNH